MKTPTQPTSKVYKLPKEVVTGISGFPSCCKSITIKDNKAILYAQSDYIVRITIPLKVLLPYLLCCLYADLPVPDSVKATCYYQSEAGNASTHEEYIGFLSVHKVEEIAWLFVDESNYVGFTEETASTYLEMLKDILI